MDKDHQMNAPDNESLATIEQLDDHSGLSTLYPHAHKEWEGSDIMSHDEREQKRDEAQQRISLTIRRWFPIIGLLIPTPFILIALLFAVGGTYFQPGDMGVLLVPAVIVIAFIWFISYRIVKFVYSIFYNHAMQATPVVAILLLLLGLSIFAVILATQPLHTGLIINDILIIGGALILLSILYSGLLLFIWSSHRLGSKVKVLLLSLIPLTVGASSWALFTL